MLNLHARSTSMCAPDLTLLRPRTPNNEHFPSDVESGSDDSDSNAPQLIQPLLFKVPQLKHWEADEPVLKIKDYSAFPSTTTTTKRRDRVVLAVAWVLSLALTSVVTFWASRQAQPRESPLGTFATGFQTELHGARAAISVKEQQFYGSLDFENHHGFIPHGSPSEKYVGSGPDIDAAWDELTKDRYFLLSDEEAREAYGENPMKYWNVHHGGYIAGLDVLHTLHCLNHLRMGLYPDVYPQDPQHATMHKAHCVEHLRQLAMCQADLTPVPTQWFDGLSRNYINSSRLHTCRDFSQIRDWATERFNGSTAVKPRNKDGSPREEFYAPWTP